MLYNASLQITNALVNVAITFSSEADIMFCWMVFHLLVYVHLQSEAIHIKMMVIFLLLLSLLVHPRNDLLRDTPTHSTIIIFQVFVSVLQDMADPQILFTGIYNDIVHKVHE